MFYKCRCRDKLEGNTREFFRKQFFTDTYDDTRGQILTRVWGVLENTTLERMFCNKRNKLNIFEAMNQGSLILINTAKDLLKQEGTEILGRFFHCPHLPGSAGAGNLLTLRTGCQLLFTLMKPMIILMKAWEGFWNRRENTKSG